MSVHHETNDKSLTYPYTIIAGMTNEELHKAETSLKRKLDLRLTSVIVFIYILNFLDRNNIAAARTAGMQESLNMTSTQFSTAVSLLFVGYILMQVPSNIFLAQLRPSLYLPGCMVVWGIMSTSTAAVQNVSGLYAVRFLLGFVEAAYYPGSLFLISSWYRRSEMGVRTALLYSGAQVGSAFSGLIAAGIKSGLDGSCGLPAWRWIFIIEGSITIFVAIVALFVLPDFPHNTKWLSTEEKAVAEWRLVQDAGEIDIRQNEQEEDSWKTGFKLAFRDWRIYIFALIFHGILVTSSTQNFFPTVVNTLGYGPTETLLLTVPPYILGAIISVLNNLSADKLRNSSFHIIWPLLVAMAGFIIAPTVTGTGPRYFSMFLMIIGGHGSNAVCSAWVSKTMLRPRMKRAAAVAFVNAVGNSAQAYTPYFYPSSSAPRYVLAMSVNAGCALGAVLLTLVMRLVLIRANAKLEREKTAENEANVSQDTRVENTKDNEIAARIDNELDVPIRETSWCSTTAAAGTVKKEFRYIT